VANGVRNRQNALDIGESSILITYLRKVCVWPPFDGSSWLSVLGFPLDMYGAAVPTVSHRVDL
jgi:hypothetical protein